MRFNPMLYSLDVVVPVLNLWQKAHWVPRTVEGTWGLGSIALIWEWFSTLMALFFALLLAGSD